MSRAGWVSLAIVAAGWTPASAQTGQPQSVTVPLHVEGDRVFVDLDVTGPNGRSRTARFWIDTGGGGVLLTETLALDLGIEWGEPWNQEGMDFARPLQAPGAALDAFPLGIVDSRVFVIVGRDNLLPEVAPGHADGFLPGHVLAQYFVVFDYPRGQFTIAQPGTVDPSGEPLPMLVSEEMRFPHTEIEVAGETHGFLLDTGASFTMVSEAVLGDLGVTSIPGGLAMRARPGMP